MQEFNSFPVKRVEINFVTFTSNLKSFCTIKIVKDIQALLVTVDFNKKNQLFLSYLLIVIFILININQ